MVTENEIFDELSSYGLTLRHRESMRISPSYYFVETNGHPHMMMSPRLYNLERVWDWWNIMKGLFKGD